MSGSMGVVCKRMWAKIAVCFVLLFHLFGNSVLAATPPPTNKQKEAQKPPQNGQQVQTGQQKQQKPPPSLEQKIRDAKNRAVTANGNARTEQKKAEQAEEATKTASNESVQAWKQVETAQDETVKAAKKTEANKNLIEAQKQEKAAKDRAANAQKYANDAAKAYDDTSTSWGSDSATLYDTSSIDAMQAEAQKMASESQTAAKEAQDAADEASKSLETAQQAADEAAAKEPFANCSTWDVWCQFEGFLYSISKGTLLLAQDGILAVFQQGNLANNPEIVMLQAGFSSLSWSFLLLFLVYQSVRILSLMILQEDHSELKSLIRRTIIAAWLISSLKWICDHLFDLGNAFTAYSAQRVTILPTKVNILLEAFVSVGNSVPMLVFLIILVVLCVIIIIQMAIRSAEFAFLVIVGPLAAVTIVNREMNLFSRWWRNLLACIFTQSIQALLFVISFRLIMGNSLGNFLAIIGFLALTMRAPKMVNEWFQSGVGTPSGGSITKGATSVVRGIQGSKGGIVGGVVGGVVSGGQALLHSLIKK